MLIQCSECKHEVSDEASKCPNCGHPLPTGKLRTGVMIGFGFSVLPLFLVIICAAKEVPLPEHFTLMVVCCVGIGLAQILRSVYGNTSKK